MTIQMLTSRDIHLNSRLPTEVPEVCSAAQCHRWIVRVCQGGQPFRGLFGLPHAVIHLEIVITTSRVCRRCRFMFGLFTSSLNLCCMAATIYYTRRIYGRAHTI